MTEAPTSDVDSIAEALYQRLDAKILVALAEATLGEDVGCIEEAYKVKSLSGLQAAKCLAALYGRAVLANREVRSALVEAAHDEDLFVLFREVYQNMATIAPVESFDRRFRCNQIVARPWHPGSRWARTFCTTFGLPLELAGDANHSSVLEIERVEPFIPLNPLHDFQEDLRAKIMLLFGESTTARALIALPTGAGKTRLMVETLLGIPEVEDGNRGIVWVAQHNELCEQAVQCFAQVWKSRSRPRNRPLPIQRVWAGKSNEIDWSSGVLIGTPESLIPRLHRSSVAERATIAAAVIDEAHHVVAASYAPLFAALSSSAIFGITATPGSSAEGGTEKILKRFMGKLLVADELGANPFPRLEALGILAKPEPRTIETAVQVSSSDFESADTETFGDLPAIALRRLGANAKRNSLILGELLKIDSKSSVLCFAPSVSSARAIAATLAMSGRNARSVDADSDFNYRNDAVHDFRSGKIQFLINYGVLATGFDAPRVDCLVLARPTTSPVLYEQMLGRGLRGPSNGGTATCTILHFEDNFTGFGGIKPMSYARFLPGFH